MDGKLDRVNPRIDDEPGLLHDRLRHGVEAERVGVANGDGADAVRAAVHAADVVDELGTLLPAQAHEPAVLLAGVEAARVVGDHEVRERGARLVFLMRMRTVTTWCR